MQLGEAEKNNVRQQQIKGGLGWIERARAKHELTHIVMGTIFLILSNIRY